MFPTLTLTVLWLLAGDAPEAPWSHVRLTVFRDPYVSSDQVTLCRVRADNLGNRSWPGRDLAFEVRAQGSGVSARARGRFGLTLEPHGSLETLVALPGRHDRLEVVPVAPRADGEREQKLRRKSGRHRRRAASDSGAR
jgi:hypothetical protein